MSTTQTADGFRMLHTMIRVKNLEKSLDFYTRLMGMKVLRQRLMQMVDRAVHRAARGADNIGLRQRRADRLDVRLERVLTKPLIRR